MKKYFEAIPDYTSKENIGLNIKVEILKKKYILIDTLESYLKEQKAQGANYIEIVGSNTVGSMEYISLHPIKII